jgi:CheY-like chemotaxis protein
VAKILVADDNSNIQKMVGLALKDQGIDVVAVGNGEAAVRKISDVRPDLVLADVFMPVRNGYEVCRYVKEDSALSHIPVILLVGAFDPLDEQEAQRVGADGVLKKPFVPPDPLISMVKSALTRAGITITAPTASAPASDKPAVPLRMSTDLMSGGMAPKLASLSPNATPTSSRLTEAVPEVVPESIEDFTEPPAQVKIPEGAGPVAFGNLLGSSDSDSDADMAITAKPMIDIGEEHKWDKEERDVAEDEEEEESPRGAWHPSSSVEDAEPAVPGSGSKSSADWRDEAFHGSSPAKHHHSPAWTPTREKTELVEAAESETVAVSTLERNPPNGSSPFSTDSWASKLAAGVEEKIAHGEPLAPPAPIVMPEPVAPPTPLVSNEPSVTAIFSNSDVAKMLEKPSAAPAETLPANQNLPAVPSVSWEAEAKRAASLASTWDAPVAPPLDPPAPPAVAHRSPEETQEVPAYTSEEHAIESRTGAVEEASAPAAYSGTWEQEGEQAAVEAAPKTIEPAASEGTVPKTWANAWESPVAPASASFEAPVPIVAPEPPPAPKVLEFAKAPAAEPFMPPVVESKPEPVSEAAAPAPDMDELVARVLGKMNPDVLQKVTREILKPVIEAIVRDELASKK